MHRALHQPRPGVVVAADTATFVDHVVIVTRRASYEWLYGLVALVLSLVSLAIIAAVLAMDDLGGVPLVILSIVPLIPMTLMVMGGPFNRVP